MSWCQVITYQVLNDTDRYMSSVYITSLYMASVRVIVEHNQVELSKLEAQAANRVSTLIRLARLPGQLVLKYE